MRIYLGQWRVESIFGEYKSNIGADTVFLQTNRRVEVLLFMVAIAAMIRAIVKLLLRKNRTRGSPVPNGVTAKRFFFLTSNMFIEVDRSYGMISLTVRTMTASCWKKHVRHWIWTLRSCSVDRFQQRGIAVAVDNGLTKLSSFAGMWGRCDRCLHEGSQIRRVLTIPSSKCM